MTKLIVGVRNFANAPNKRRRVVLKARPVTREWYWMTSLPLHVQNVCPGIEREKSCHTVHCGECARRRVVDNVVAREIMQSRVSSVSLLPSGVRVCVFLLSFSSPKASMTRHQTRRYSSMRLTSYVDTNFFGGWSPFCFWRYSLNEIVGTAKGTPPPPHTHTSNSCGKLFWMQHF